MDELTMLVQLAGGEPETVRRLRTAGFRRAHEIASADADEIRAKAELSASEARRLMRAAKRVLSPASKRGPRYGRPALLAVPSRTRTNPATRALESGHGVSQAETRTLTGEAACDEQDLRSQSFWRFG